MHWRATSLLFDVDMTATASRSRPTSHHNITPLPSSQQTTRETKASSIFLLSLNMHGRTHTHTHWHAPPGAGSLLFLFLLTCCVFFYLWIMHEIQLYIWNGPQGLFGFSSGCGGALHVPHVCSLSFPSSLHRNDTYSQKKKNFLQTDFMQQALWPHFLHY